MQEVQINALMDHIYLDFMRKVAAGRKLTLEQVKALAKGQVYTGQQALEVRLGKKHITCIHMSDI